MNELAKIPLEKYVIPRRDSDIVQAYNDGRIIAYVDDYTLWELFKTAITASYAMSRFAPPGSDEMTIMTDTITSVAKTRYGQLRDSEISVLFVRGITGDFGPFKGLSVITFVDWIKGYLKEATRQHLTLPPAPEVKEPTLAEKFDTAANNAISAIKNYSEGKDISLVAPSVYKFLRRLNLFEYTDKEQDEFMKQAALDVVQYLNQKKAMTMDKYKRLEIERALTSEQSIQDKTLIHARRLGLYRFFQKCIKAHVNLSELIEEKRKEVLK